MIDVVTVGAGGGSVAWVSPEGALKVGPRSAGADPGPLCYGKGGTEPTVTDAHVVLGRIPPHLLGGEIPLDVAAARTGLEALAGAARPRRRADRDRHPGDLGLEPGQRPPRGHRQARSRRARLHDGDVRRLRVAPALPAGRRARAGRGAGAARPGQPLGVRPAHGRRPQRLRAHRGQPPRRPRPRDGRQGARRPAGAGGGRAGPRGLRARRAPLPAQRRPALRRSGVRGPRPGAGRGGRRRVRRQRSPGRSTTRTSSSTATRSAATPGSRSSGSTCGSPVSARSSGHSSASSRRATAASSARAPAYARCASTSGPRRPSTGGRTWRRVTWSRGRRSSRSSARPCRCTPASRPPSTASATCW